jgi:hypothetical protein
MKELHPLKRRRDEGTAHRLDWATGSWFLALPSGVRKSASQHPHGYFNDESTHQPAWKETLNTVRQVINALLLLPSSLHECLLAG